jgi:hypothetical protein
MNKAKLIRRVAAVAASAALSVGAFAVAPLSADAAGTARKSNWSHSTSFYANGVSHSDQRVTAYDVANGV